MVYTDFQRAELEKEFIFNSKYITIKKKGELSLSLGLSERQIKIWFQNRRAKDRKQLKRRVQETLRRITTSSNAAEISELQKLLEQQKNLDEETSIDRFKEEPVNYYESNDNM